MSLSLLLALGLAGAGGPASPEALPQSPIPISGRLLSPDGRPLPAAVAELLPWTPSDTMPEVKARATVDGGNLKLRVPTVGMWRVRVRAPGYPPVLSPPIAVVEESEIPDLRLAGAPGRPASEPPEPRRFLKIAGRVLDRETRQGLAGAVVWVEDAGAALWARTDAEGRFALNGSAATAHLHAAAAGYLELDREAPAPGQTRFLLQRACRVTGRIADSEGRPLGGATVYLSSPAAGPPAAALLPAQSDERGMFHFGPIAAGRFDLAVFLAGYRQERKTGLTLTGQQDLGTLALTQVARLAGRVIDESGAPVGQAALLLSRGGENAGAVRADSEGRFAFEELTPGPVRLTALAPGFLPAALAEVETAPGDDFNTPEIEVVLRSGAVLFGTVSTPSGLPAAGARVMVLDNGAEGPFAGLELPQAIADEQGRYRMEGVATGNRPVRVSLRGFLPDTRQTAVLSGAQRLNLRLRRGTAVSGRAVTSTGEPVDQAEIYLLPLGDHVPPAPAQTGAEGTFFWPSVAPGRFRLEAERAGLAAHTIHLEVTETPVTDLVVTFAAAGALQGRITGLEPGEAERLEIRASAPEHRDRTGRILADGSYRIDDLAPGLWGVSATLPEAYRAARGNADVAPGPGETFLDLEMGGGIRLEGRVERQGTPVAKVLVAVQGEGASAVETTGADGSFRFEGLMPGDYTVIAAHPASGAKKIQQVELEHSRGLTIELP